MARLYKTPILPMGFIIGIALLSACSSVSPPPSSFASNSPVVNPNAPLAVAVRYQPAPTLSVLVVPNFSAGREGELIALAKAECTGRSFCSVGFWADDAEAPRRLKMSSDQMSNRIVQFAINSRTGLNKTTWNCRIATNVLGDCA